MPTGRAAAANRLSVTATLLPIEPPLIGTQGIDA
jgi:hypothetical protein